MANIQTYLDNIKNAVYGEEVRSSIHDAIKAINDSGTGGGGSGGSGGGSDYSVRKFTATAVQNGLHEVTIVEQDCAAWGPLVTVNLRIHGIQGHSSQELCVATIPSTYAPDKKIYCPRPGHTNTLNDDTEVTPPTYAVLRPAGGVYVPWTYAPNDDIMVSFTYLTTSGDGEVINDEIIEDPVE